jgi:TonB family protein
MIFSLGPRGFINQNPGTFSNGAYFREMKKLGVIGLLASASISAFAQINVKLAYDLQWRLTIPDSATYFRTTRFDTIKRVFDGEVRDVTRNGDLVMDGRYKEGKKTGVFHFYSKNGKIQSVGDYKDGLRTGLWKYYYYNGALMNEIEYGSDVVKNVISCFDSVGTMILVNGTGILIEEYEEPVFSQRVVNRGRLKDLKKVGEWTCQLMDGTPLYNEKYGKYGFESGKGSKLLGMEEYNQPLENHLLPHYKFYRTETFVLDPHTSYDTYPYFKPKGRIQSQRKHPADSLGDEIFTVVEESAYPPGGMAALYQFIGQNIQYPLDARKKRIQGRVFVEFIIHEDGLLSNFKVIKGIGGGCDEEAVRVLQQYANQYQWDPAKQRGKAVKQRFVIPITFRLG